MAGIERLAQQVAAKGRYGDSELVHMNPEEIAVLQSMLGEMTVNPETGMLEAFSWKKLLAGLGAAAAVAAAPFTGGTTLTALSPLLGTLGGGLIASSFADSDKKKDDPKLSEAGAYLKARNAEEMRNMYFFPERQMLNPSAVGSRLGAQQNHFSYVEPMKSGIGSLGYQPQKNEDVERRAEGGALEPEEMEAHRVMAEAMAAIDGKSPNPEKAINDFIAMFGKEALAELMGQTEQSQGDVRGPGGGMDDMVSADLQGQKVLLSPNEHIIPADAVSHLGDGSSDAGHRELDAMIERIRLNKTGNPAQPPKINQKVMAM